MIRITISFLFALETLLSVVYAAAPPLKDWQKCLGGNLQDIPGALIRAKDGNILLLGNVDSNNGNISSNAGSTDIWLTKLDTIGNIIWQKSIGGTSIDVGSAICELPNGNLVIAGYSSSTDGNMISNIGNFDVVLICTNPAGNILWIKNFGGTQVDLCYSMIRSSDGGFILGGGSYSNDVNVTPNHGDQDFWVMKADSLGNLVWQVSSGGTGIDICYAVDEDASGNIYASGTTNSSNGDVTFTHGFYDVWVIKYSSSGNVLWKKTFGGTEYETAQSILIDDQQKILIGGYTRSSNGDVSVNRGYGDTWLFQIGAQGNLVCEKTFGGSGSESLYSLIQTNDGGYLLTSGSTSSDYDINNKMGMEDVWMYKIDPSFHKEWSKNYGGSSNERPVDVIQNIDGGFLISAYSFSNDSDVHGQHGTADIWLLNLSCKVPTALFFMPNSACLGDTVRLIDASVNSSVSQWYLNNTLNTTGNMCMLSFANPGFYRIQLNAQTCYNNSDLVADLNVINCNLPQINFSAQQNHVCAESNVVFNDASVNATGWQWTFPGGIPATSTAQNPVVRYDQPGNYSVLLTVTNFFGSQSTMKLNYVNVNTLPNKPVITTYGNEFVSTPANAYQWNLNSLPIANATSQDLLAILDGNYTVLVTDNNGCSRESDPVFYSMTNISDRDENTFKLYPNPVVNEMKVQVSKTFTGEVSLYNMSGQKVMEHAMKKNEKMFTADLSLLANGIYSLVFTENNRTIQKQYIIKNNY